MKASLLIVVTDRADSLRNTLYSIARQKTSFPFEVCILDVGSSTDLEPLIREFLPDVKYKKLNKNVDFIYTKGMCLDLAIPDSDIIVIQANDVIQTKDFTLEELCKNVGPKTIALAEVVDMPIGKDLYMNFEQGVGEILNNWNNYIKRRKATVDGVPYKLATYRTGKDSSALLFFLGAIRREDLESLDFTKNNCDAVIGPKIRQNKFIVNYPAVRAIHQRHTKFTYPCPLVNSCKFHCIRKTDHEKKIRRG